MRTSEAWSGLNDNSITIVYEDGKIEKIELKRLKIGDLSQNLLTINEYLNKVHANGYELISTAGGGGDNFIYTTYTFKKNKY